MCIVPLVNALLHRAEIHGMRDHVAVARHFVGVHGLVEKQIRVALLEADNQGIERGAQRL